MPCKQCQCAISEEVKSDAASCTIPSKQQDKVSLTIELDTDVVEQLQALDPQAKLPEIIQDYLKTQAW